MSAENSKSDRFANRLRQNLSLERLMLMRNLGYGGAAACLVILLGLTQPDRKALCLKISVISVSFALPLWLLLGIIYEYYIFLGKESYSHLHTKLSRVFVLTTASIAGLGIVLGTGGVIYFLMPVATYVFAGVGFIAVIFGWVFQTYLMRWWFSNDGPEPNRSIKRANSSIKRHALKRPNVER